jgi:DNA recombination protein RmuC
MDITAQIIASIIISSLTFVIGYFFANNKAKVSQAELKHTKENLEDLQQKANQANIDLKQIREDFNEKCIEIASLTSKLVAKQEQLDNSVTEQEKLQSKYDTLQDQHKNDTAELAELKTSIEERDKKHKEQLALIKNQEQQLSDSFKNIANDILKENTQSLEKNNKNSLDAIIKPFQTSIDDFKKEVKDNRDLGITQHTNLTNELTTLQKSNQKITQEAHELTTALKGQKKLQGNWGELMLENILENSGLRLNIDYKREVSFNTEDGKKRPDAIINLPQEKHLIIDAKVSLNAYTQYVNAEDESQSKQALKEHVAAIKARIKELSAKNYYKLEKINSPEIVFMFVPIESAFIVAMQAEPTLFQAAINQNILVATPTTLLTSLNIIKQLWRYEDQNKHTAALASKAEGIFDKLRLFLDSFTDVKKGLSKALESYNKAEGQLVNGTGNLVKRVNEFKDLAPKITQKLPDYFTDKAELEIECTDDEHPSEQK